MSLYILIGIIVVVVGALSLRVINQYESGVLFTLGQFSGVRTAGLNFVFPLIQKMRVVDKRLIALDVPPQDIITRDNVSVKVNAVIYFRVQDTAKAIIQVENYLYTTSQQAQTTLRSVCGEVELDDLLARRDVLNKRIREIINSFTDPWGIEVFNVEIKDIDLPQEMQRAMAKQAEAERERRARIIQAEGEYQAAEKLTAAAQIMSGNSATLQLRYLDTLRHIATDKNSTIIFPLPLEIFKHFLSKDKE